MLGFRESPQTLPDSPQRRGRERGQTTTALVSRRRRRLSWMQFRLSCRNAGTGPDRVRRRRAPGRLGSRPPGGAWKLQPLRRAAIPRPSASTGARRAGSRRGGRRASRRQDRSLHHAGPNPAAETRAPPEPRGSLQAGRQHRRPHPVAANRRRAPRRPFRLSKALKAPLRGPTARKPPAAAPSRR